MSGQIYSKGPCSCSLCKYPCQRISLHTFLGNDQTIDLHPRKRKIKASKDHSRDSKNESSQETSSLSHNVTHCNPYQMYIHIRKQVSISIIIIKINHAIIK